MKKIINLLVALILLLGVSSMSAQQISDMSQFKLTGEEAVRIEFSQGSYAAASASRSSFNIVPGEYATICNPIDFAASQLGYESYGGITEITEVGDDEYVLRDFLSSGFDIPTFDLPAQIIHDYHIGAALSIPGNGQTPLYSQAGENFYMWLAAYAPSLGKFKLFGNDIVFVSPSSGLLAFPSYNLSGLGEDAIIGIVFLSPSGAGTMIAAPYMGRVNGKMTTKEHIDESDEGEDVEYPLYIEIYEDVVISGLIYGIAEAPYPCCIAYDKESGYAYGWGEAIYTEATGSLYYTQRLGSDNFNAQYSIDNEKMTFTVDHLWYIGNKDVCWKIFSDTTIEYYLSTTGVKEVEAVTAEQTEVAPEYYNLQGILVAAPVSGQLYIVKRGTSAIKVVYSD